MMMSWKCYDDGCAKDEKEKLAMVDGEEKPCLLDIYTTYTLALTHAMHQ